MLRYIERAGLLAPARAPSGYRLYDITELDRLRSLKQLLTRFDIDLSDVAFAARVEADSELQAAMRDWLEPLRNAPPTATLPHHRTSSVTAPRRFWRPSASEPGNKPQLEMR